VLQIASVDSASASNAQRMSDIPQMTMEHMSKRI
jgi:hypothetical protein